MKKKVAAKVDTNHGSKDKTFKDLRGRFLSNQNYQLMKYVLRFATDYVQGVVRVNDLAEMNCDDLKYPEKYKQAFCQGECGKKFNNGNKILFCVVDTEQDDDNGDWEKFKLVCNICSNDYSYQHRYEVMQLFPTVSLGVVERLCKVGFLTKYIFPINLDYSVTTTKTEVCNYHNFYKMVKSIVREKKSNEHIVEIKLSTYGRDLFSETDDNCAIRNSVNEYNEHVYELEFHSSPSTMLPFVQTYVDAKPLTYFYTITKRIYLSLFDYVVYFPIKCTFFCKMCKENKLYLKTHPVLYCSKCGFTDAMFFKNAQFLKSAVFLAKCVKAKTLSPTRIYYYDINEYKSYINKPSSKNMLKNKN
ncbi:major early transcription protein 53 [Alphabaculovirus altersperidaniae]|uniref:Major early transcription protein 53 n=1 Tax=Spodoptera eridania nucleopolyhedrovirus TaxID=2315721 RepID=A0ABX6TQ36_9ABAC|nr:major early transcription protein 53 [Spodoptera eridania nucleopolyhedrovirus]QNV47770.1 major early transcription protein 53 [Spodoptera eridania nucleopolyhedrovirus]